MKKNNTQIETVEYDDNIYHAPPDCSTTRETVDRAAEARDAIFDLLLAGKLDKTDIKIIEARNCSPLPSNMEMSRTLKIPEATIRLRLAKLISLITVKLQKNI